MRTARHVLRLVLDVLTFGVATRRWSFVVVVLLALGVTALVVTSQAVAPIALYPFI